MDRDRNVLVKIYRFRGICDKSVVLPNCGVVCIDGPNGCGKSTLLDAISWTLFGYPKESYNILDQNHHKRKTSMVSVTLPGTLLKSGGTMCITRSDRPSTLKCEYISQNLSDTNIDIQGCVRTTDTGSKRSLSGKHTPTSNPKRAALELDAESTQAIINREVCPSSEWKAFAYASHTKTKDFLSLNSASKLQLLTDMCNGDDTPVELFKNLCSVIKGWKRDRDVCQGKIEAHVETASKQRASIANQFPGRDVNRMLRNLEDPYYFRDIQKREQTLLQSLSHFKAERMNLEQTRTLLADREKEIDSCTLTLKGVNPKREKQDFPATIAPLGRKLGASLLSCDLEMLISVGEYYASSWLKGYVTRHPLINDNLQIASQLATSAENMEKDIAALASIQHVREFLGLMQERFRDKGEEAIANLQREMVERVQQGELLKKELQRCKKASSLLEMIQEANVEVYKQRDDKESMVEEVADVSSRLASRKISANSCDIASRELEIKCSSLESKIASCKKDLEAVSVKIRNLKEKEVTLSETVATVKTNVSKLETTLVTESGSRMWKESNRLCPCCKKEVVMGEDRSIYHADACPVREADMSSGDAADLAELERNLISLRNMFDLSTEDLNFLRKDIQAKISLMHEKETRLRLLQEELKECVETKNKSNEKYKNPIPTP